MLQTVSQLSAPNAKQQLVNRLFRNVVALEQLQRVQALQGKGKKYNTYFTESNNIGRMLDTLQVLCEGDTQQIQSVQLMKQKLLERDKLYLNYLAKRTEYINNDTLKDKLKSLTELIGKSGYSADSNVVTTASKKVITTTIVPADDISGGNKSSVWNKIFGRKKNTNDNKPKQLVKEELDITTDTLKLGSKDSSLQKLSETITSVEITRSNKRDDLINRQMQLNQNGNILIGEILEVLNGMEQEDATYVAKNNANATRLANRNLWLINMLLIAFMAGAALLTYLILIDIVRSNRYKKALISAKEEAEELGQIKQRFLSNMSHELRTPLQAIVGMAEQVNMKGVAEKQDINMIYQSSQHLLQIVNEVLDYSLITSGKFRLESITFDILQVLQEVRDVMQVQAKAHGLFLVFDVTIDKGKNYIGDPFRLKQILYNLLGNAIKFTPAGEITLHAEQKDFSAYSMFTFAIKDTGVGISDKDLDRIFNQFEQGDAPTALQQQGTGLGLSIVKTLVDSQKGTIKAESNPGGGSVFIVTLPYTHAKGGDNQHLHSARVSELTLITGAIWVIDDDPMILQLCKSILDKHKVDNRCFYSPYDMLKAIQNKMPAIILMDIRMPEMTGFELLNKLKPLLHTDTMVFALTAHALPEDREDILRPGFNDVLMKPFMERDLLNILSGNSVEQNAEQDNTGFDELAKMTGGDKDLLKSILQQFVDDTIKDKQLLLHNAENNDATEVAEQLHKLAGRCGQVGFKELGAELRTVEIHIRNGNAIPKATLEQLYKSISAAIDAANHHLSSLIP